MLALHDRGVAYYEKHDYDRAIADFEQLVAANANFVAHSSAKDVALDRNRGYERSGDVKRIEPADQAQSELRAAHSTTAAWRSAPRAISTAPSPTMIRR